MLQIFFFSLACYMLINSFLSGTRSDYIIALLAIALFMAVALTKKNK